MRIAVAGATGLIGSQLTALARQEGHDVVEIARESGFDLLAPGTGPIEAALVGADAAVDVTSTGGILSDQETLDFFTTVARNLGEAATTAGRASASMRHSTAWSKLNAPVVSLTARKTTSRSELLARMRRSISSSASGTWPGLSIAMGFVRPGL